MRSWTTCWLCWRRGWRTARSELITWTSTAAGVTPSLLFTFTGRRFSIFVWVHHRSNVQRRESVKRWQQGRVHHQVESIFFSHPNNIIKVICPSYWGTQWGKHNHKFSTSIPLPTKITRHGKINFVDLAGSEMTKKTKSEGKTLEEANNINKSLMVTLMSFGVHDSCY